MIIERTTNYHCKEDNEADIARLLHHANDGRAG